MAKVNAPLLGFGAAGTIGKTQVYASWRGIPYARRWVIPSNPQSANQTKTRSVFTWLNAVWKQAPALFQEPWTSFSTGAKFTNRNAFISKNLGNLRAGTDTTLMLGSPGAKGGLSPTGIVVTAGSGTLTVAFTNPTAPTGWVLTAAVAAAIDAADPHTATNYNIVAGQDTATMDSVALSGLSAKLYHVMAWLKWTKPDGSFAYGVSLLGSGTPT